MPRISTSDHPFALFRHAKGLTQDQFAKLIGAKRSAIQNAELGRRPASLDLLARFARAAGHDLHVLAEIFIQTYRERIYRELGLVVPAPSTKSTNSRQPGTGKPEKAPSREGAKTGSRRNKNFNPRNNDQK